MLAIVIILATLLVLSAGLHVYQVKQVNQAEETWSYDMRVVADALRNTDHAQKETARWRQRCFSTLDRNLWLRTRLEELQVQYDDLFVRYCKQSLSATDISEDAAEILGEFIDKAAPPPTDWDFGPKPEDPIIMVADEHVDSVEILGIAASDPVFGSGWDEYLGPMLVDDASDIEVPIDYYLVDRGE